MEFEDLNVMFGYESKLIFLHPDNCTLRTIAIFLSLTPKTICKRIMAFLFLMRDFCHIILQLKPEK